jgi:hypothetical protein
MGRGVFVYAKPCTPSRLAHAKSDVSDLANMKAKIGNCRFWMARDIAMLRIAFF